MRRLLGLLALLCAVPVPAAHAQVVDEGLLALRFRPALYFAPTEPWRPLEIERFLAERSPPGPRHRRCIERKGDDTCHIADAPGDLRAPWDHLDLFGHRKDGRDAWSPYLRDCGSPHGAKEALRDCDRQPWSVIYYNLTATSRFIYLDYWWFMRFNEFVGDHEGDWEGVTVVVTREPVPRVHHVNFAAHGDALRYPEGVPTFEGDHVRVYVARGSHASYPRPCARRCRQSRRSLPEREFPGGHPWPANADGECLTTCVRPLPEHDPDPAVHRRENAASWNGWSGRWGRPGRFASGPRSPGWQERYRAPWRARSVKRTAF